jgi:hypothetical protein
MFDHLNKPGGHIVVLLFLVALGLLALKLQIPKADQIVFDSLTVLLMLLSSKQSVGRPKGRK